MKLALRGLLIGLAFGLATSFADLAAVSIGTIMRRFGPGPVFLLQTAALEMGLAALLGLIGAPLLRIRVGRLPASGWLLIWLVSAWLLLGQLAPFEAPMALPLLYVPPLAGLALAALGLWLARWKPWLPWLAGGIALFAASWAAQFYINATIPEAAPVAARPDAREGAPDIVLVVLDTVRAENTSTYGHTRKTSPTLDRLAAEGALFEDATSPSTWSMPSHASLFTGRYPSSHGAHGEHLELDQRFPTLAQVLVARGYETYCFTSNAWISDGLGLTRGFDWQDGSWKEEGGAGRNFLFIYRLLDRLGLLSGDKGGARVAENFRHWTRERPLDARPSFVFLNFIEAHFPYHQLPADYAQRYTDRPMSELKELSMALMGQQFGGPGRDAEEAAEPARDMYDGGVLYSDEMLRRVVEAIRERGTLDQTVLVVLADHGEVLGEWGNFFGHGPSVHQEAVSVPLVVRYPPVIPAGTRIAMPVSTLGVFGTILELAGVEAPPTLHVGSLMPVVLGLTDSPGPVLSERMKPIMLGGEGEDLGPLMRGSRRYRSYRSGDWKLVETSEGEAYLFDLASAEGESRDLAASQPEQLAVLQAGLASVRLELGLPALDALEVGEAAPDLDEATRERLRQLGYLE